VDRRQFAIVTATVCRADQPLIENWGNVI